MIYLLSVRPCIFIVLLYFFILLSVRPCFFILLIVKKNYYYIIFKTHPELLLRSAPGVLLDLVDDRRVLLMGVNLHKLRTQVLAIRLCV